MKRFLLFALTFAAEIGARRVIFEQEVRAGKSAHLSFQDAARAALVAADTALLHWETEGRRP